MNKENITNKISNLTISYLSDKQNYDKLDIANYPILEIRLNQKVTKRFKVYGKSFDNWNNMLNLNLEEVLK